MATIEFKGADEYIKKLTEMGARIQGTIKYASYEAAGIVADAIKAAVPQPPKDGTTGDLRDSIALTKYRTENGFTYTKVVFDGYDRKGVPNALKANALESGRSDGNGNTVGKHAFIRKAVKSVEKAAEFSIETALNKRLEELMK